MNNSTKLGCNKPMFVLQTYEDRLAHKELSQKLSARLSHLTHSEQESERLPTVNNRQINVDNPPPPPPPPPLTNELSSPTESTQTTRSNTLKLNKTKPKAPPVPTKYSVLSYNQPPPCPTPDYDTISISSYSSNSKPSQIISDAVEMESLDSFKIHNPSEIKPKPPNTYFQKQKLSATLSNGSTYSMNSIKKPRPVSVTIGEYPSMRRQPGRLDFLHNDMENNKKSEPLSHQLTSELTQTLNRSNLRKRTESMENLLGHPQIKPQSNGTVRISVSNGLSKNFAKSTSDLTEDMDSPSNISNRVVLNVNQDKKSDVPNGILKNGNGISTNFFSSPPSHKPLVQQKSITFGEM